MQEKEPSGILVLNKPSGITSHDAVYKIRKLYSTKRVGHTGTLDPLAEGVLVMLVGKAAKAAEYLVCDSKKYVATLKLGITTDTEDITGKVLSSCDEIPEFDTVKDTVALFCGEIEQIPPMYSALKVDGKKLCDLAREGKMIDRATRKITVHDISVQPTPTRSEYLLSVCCSSGTYIRTLCADIGARLGCGGVMSTLMRTAAGSFSIDDSFTLSQLEEMTQEERFSLLIPTEELFSLLPAVSLPAFYHRLCINGCEIYQKKIHTDFAVGERVRLCSPNGEFFALGEVKNYNGGTAIKAIKFL